MLLQVAKYWRRVEAYILIEATGITEVRQAWVNEVSWPAIGRKREV